MVSSSFRLHPSSLRSAYTLIEMLTTVAVLIIVMGLMISLARHVRSRAADHLTRSILVKLDALMAQYARENGGRLPAVQPLVASGGSGSASEAADPSAAESAGEANGSSGIDEAEIQRAAPENNRQFVLLLRRQQNLTAGIFSDLPNSIYDEVSLYDAWGSPIAFMPQGVREIGTAPQDRFFFFSAGPDRRYLTRDDNLYSYETSPGDPLAPEGR